MLMVPFKYLTEYAICGFSYLKYSNFEKYLWYKTTLSLTKMSLCYIWGWTLPTCFNRNCSKDFWIRSERWFYL